MESKRAYHSPRRQEQAQATRQKILDAARDLFTEHGYVATSLPAIARRAGVSAPTVSAVFGTKKALLEALFDLRKWDLEEPIHKLLVAEWYALLEEPDAVRQFERFVTHGQQMQAELAAIDTVVREAAASDPEIAALWQDFETGRYGGFREVMVSLAAKQALKPGLSIEEATDWAWALGSPEIYRMLIRDRGWPPEKYQSWLASTLITSLMG